MTSADDIIEEETDEHPRYVVERRRRWQGARRPKDERKIEVLERVHLQLLVQHPLNKWCNGAQDEEEYEGVIELAMREQTLWSDDTPL